MSQIQIDDAIAHFKEIIAKGEKVTVLDGLDPVAEILPVSGKEPRQETPKPRRKIGTGLGQVIIHPSFFDPLPDDELALWNCEGNEEDEK